ncbi:UvrABC system protein B [Metamycoplasma alkalescens 14918]|uniref:UvrABC system protein B n=1 Tax=Metamycoplasma alkalescens 14918 TaxID=1188234 RepID=N9UAB7_9BACT|nr:excinuclease ABC subunit UvrB [Metamycoplasma alkalescens]ENY53853.1 UvrABC system protein B [Metamycoplasma alkalescens 14918]
MNKFKMVTNFVPSGDQPKAIKELVDGINNNKKHQVLLGVTGSGKTFTLANVINETNRPALVISHNKTLASQIYQELKELFPHNKVEYFISYFDYYRPEAYKPAEDLYIEKSSITNKEIEAMRISTLNSLISRYDTIVVASVASIYGAFNPEEYKKHFLKIEVGKKITKKEIRSSLTKMHYTNKGYFPEIEQGEFKSVGDTITISPGYKFEYLIRIELFDDEISAIKFIDPITKEVIESIDEIIIYPCTSFLINQNYVERICEDIEEELKERIEFFKTNNKLVEAQRIESRVFADIDSIKEFGYTSGMENYARYIDGREAGQKPYTLFDYLHKDTILYIDESHLMLPQIKGMYEGDRSRKEKLVDYGWRLPSALDNRPLKYDEYKAINLPRIYLSATPGDEEIALADGEVITQFIRPTGLLDPVIKIMPKQGQIQKIHDLLKNQIANNERSLILTHTKQNAEELTKYLKEHKIKSAYIHEEFEVFERNAILTGLRMGKYDVVIGINLLREGIDLPEVSLILVLDADVSGLGRDKRSLIQIVGRAARNDHGQVIFFADKISKSMEDAINDNKLKREIQMKYNKDNNIVPKTIIKPIPTKSIDMALNVKFKKDLKTSINKSYINELVKEMKEAAKRMEFDKAIEIQNILADLGYNKEK